MRHTMGQIEIDLPEDLYTRFQHLAEEEFITEEEAVEELLARGLDAYTFEAEVDEGTDIAEEFAGDMWDTADEPMEDDDDFAF